MSNDLLDCAETGDLEGVKQSVEAGADMEETDNEGMTALSLVSLHGHFEIVVYLVELRANVAHIDEDGMTALHCACVDGNLPSVKYLLEHGARISERSAVGSTALLYATAYRHLDVVQFLLSLEGGASITETDDMGSTALLVTAGTDCYPSMVHWLLEYGGAQITDTDNNGNTVWTTKWDWSLPDLLRGAYAKDDEGKYVFIDGVYVPNGDTVALLSMLRVMVLHGGPPKSFTADLAPPLQQIVQDGVRLRARLPAYLAQRRALLKAHCPLLLPLQDLVHGYEEPTTTDELWATGLGALLQRSKQERGRSPERRSARLRQKRL
jgi:hypothetical protein